MVGTGVSDWHLAPDGLTHHLCHDHTLLLSFPCRCCVWVFLIMCLCPAQILLFQLLIELILKLTNISCLLWKCSHFFYSVPRRDASWIWRMHFIPFVVLSRSVTSSSRVYRKAQRWQTHGSFNTVDYSPFHHFISALRLNALKWRPLSQHG